jgi:hypothetical protein
MNAYDQTSGPVVNIPDSYSGGTGFKYLSEEWLSWLRFFMVFLSPSTEMLQYYVKLGHEHFLRYSFFPIPKSPPFILALCIELLRVSSNKLQINI